MSRQKEKPVPYEPAGELVELRQVGIEDGESDLSEKQIEEVESITGANGVIIPPVDTVGDPVRREHYAQALEPVCRALGISIHLPPRIRPRPYTRLAMEGQLFAEQYGKAEEYSDRVFDAYYVEEQDIGSPAVLTALAAEAGLPAEEFSAALQNGTYTRELLERERFAVQTYRPETVPLIVINDTVRLDGDIYSVEQYRDALLAR